ncbi:hypothetical protein K458DRAFT_423159 [Lentithecium fluviatile CBS 122367]|uniref:Uncharacterized protein n=1 Tax=Lentithecium fluviatile CBS 122367 TaxID=1168545 RepID=A0A6G1IKQ9_9PLEO|nr:hypothetical protein K458DRAFT_423159 [Lentithecium fluviatile CBS 122367]
MFLSSKRHGFSGSWFSTLCVWLTGSIPKVANHKSKFLELERKLNNRCIPRIKSSFSLSSGFLRTPLNTTLSAVRPPQRHTQAPSTTPQDRNMRLATSLALALCVSSAAAMAVPRPWIQPSIASIRAQHAKNDIPTPTSQRELRARNAHKLHSHADYLQNVQSPTTHKATRQRRSVVNKNCAEICSNRSVTGVTGCTWNCGGHPETPTCPEFVPSQLQTREEKKLESRYSMRYNCAEVCGKGGVGGFIACN